MKNLYVKLAASVLSILIALTMIVGATFAWFTLSSSPEIGGINVTIGGGRTILLAPDMTEIVQNEAGESVTVHYPGEFGSVLDISAYESSYGYLKEVSGLSPVSTADGLYWMLPTYDEETGELNSYREFQVDGTLQHANQTAGGSGNYIYLDFWIVSPGEEFDIRVSMDTKESTGSYLIELPKAEETESGLTLSEPQGIMEKIARVGFLVNTENAGEETVTAYHDKAHSVKQYNKLAGIYQEKGKVSSGAYQFVIYEPNALDNGAYTITKPLSYNPYGDVISEKDISKQLMIQKNNHWIAMGNSTKLEQFFQSYIVNKENMNADTAADMFYEEYKGQLDAYIESGNFYKRTAALYEAAKEGVVSAEAVDKLLTGGAADDVMITTITPNIPQRIRMYIWLEGQDADCTNSASVETSSFVLNLELAGAN